MSTHRTTAGKVKIGLALDPHAYELLKEMAPGQRALGTLLEGLIREEAARRESPALRESPAPPEASEQKGQDRAARILGTVFAGAVDPGRLAISEGQWPEAEHKTRHMLETLQTANSALTHSLDLDAVLEGLLDYLGELVPYDSANVMLRTDEGLLAVRAARGYERWTDPVLTRNIAFDIHTNPLMREVFGSHQSLLVPDTAHCAGWERVPGSEHVRSWLAIPLVASGRMLGIFSVDKAVAGFFTQEHVRLAEALAPQAAVAIQNAQLYAEVKTGREQLQALSRRLVELQEQERRALSRDLHDTSGQNITALKLGLGTLKRTEGCPDAIRGKADELLQLADTVSEDLHRLAVNLRPISLDRYGLVPALEQLLTGFRNRAGIDVAFDAFGSQETPIGRLPGAAETALYRIVQESLTNIARYAHAGMASVILRTGDDFAQVIVEDDGQGFDLEEALRSGRLGLLGMRERAEMLGGSLEIESRPGCGTTIYATVPLADTAGLASAPGPASGTGMAPGSGWAEAPAAPGPGATERKAPEPDVRLAELAELARAKALSDALVEITAAVSQCSGPDEILGRVLMMSAEAIGLDDAHIVLRADGAWDVRHAYRANPEQAHFSDSEAPAFVWLERTHKVLVVNDATGADLDAGVRLGAAYMHVKSYACIPLLTGDRLLGVLSFVNYAAPAVFHPSEVEFLNRLAALLALALENARLREIETRQRAELAQRVEELQALLDLLPVGVAISYGPEGRVIRANPANELLLGAARQANVSLNTGELPQEADYQVYQDGRQLHPDELPMQMAGRGRMVRDMVVELMRGDGTSVTLLTSAVPLLDAEGKPRGAVGSFVDITALRRAQAEAEDARRTLAALMEYIPEGITIAERPDVFIRHVSRYGQNLLGSQHADMTAGGVAAQWTVYGPDGVTPLAEEELPLVRAIHGGETVRDVEVVQVDSQGRRLPLLCNAGPIRDQDGRVTGGIVAWRDITALKQAQAQREAALAALTNSEERYRSLFNAMTEGFALHELVCDASGKPVDYRFLAFNPAFEALTGLKREAVEGQLKSAVLPGDDPYWLDIYGRVALTGEPVHFDNYSTALDRWYDVYAYRPAPLHFAVIFTEVSERKRAEERGRRQKAMQEAINAILEAALTSATDEAFGRAALAVCERVTGSKFGFIGEINAQGGLDDIAISDPGWDMCRIDHPAGHGKLPQNMPVHGIYGRVLLDGKGLFTNAPTAHADRIGTPTGHPPLTAFLGVPLTSRGQTVGMIGLGNREGGYQPEDQEAAESLASLIVEALERKRAEEKIRRLNEKLTKANGELEAILSAIPDGLIVYDAAGKVARMNDLALDMLGYHEDTWRLPVSQRVGTAVQAFHPDGSPCARDEYVAVRALRGEVVRNEDQFVHLPERPERDFWAMLSGGPIWGSDGQLAGALVTMTNTGQLHAVSLQLAQQEAALKQANAQLQEQAEELRVAAVRLEQRVQQRTAELLEREAALAEANAALREQADLLDLTHDAVFVKDLDDATIRYWNRGAEERYGWTAAEAIGQHSHALLRTVFPEPLEAIYSQVVRNGRWEGELTHFRCDGTQITVASRWALKRDKHGRPQAVLEINHDITEYKRSEAQRAAAVSALEESHAQLRALSHRLVEAQERERRYVADQLYNEAGQVLAALKLHLARAAAGGATGAHFADTQYLLDRVMADLHHLATHLRPAILDRLGLVSAVRQYAQEWGREHRVEVQFEALGLEGSRLDGDVEIAVYRVVQEALMNVAQHAHAHTVGIIASRVADRLVVIVEDDGAGFDVVAVAAQGAVGLLGMRERAESLGGQLFIESAAGQGTSVTMEVPLGAGDALR